MFMNSKQLVRLFSMFTSKIKKIRDCTPRIPKRLLMCDASIGTVCILKQIRSHLLHSPVHYTNVLGME